jgi:hypothetical protein
MPIDIDLQLSGKRRNSDPAFDDLNQERSSQQKRYQEGSLMLQY